MTGPPDGASDEPESPVVEPGAGPLPEPDSGPPLGIFRFAIDGRQAPGLFVAGWLAALIGGGAALVGVFAGQTPAGALLFVIGLATALAGLILLGGAQAIERRVSGLAYAGPSPVLIFVAIVVGLYLAVVVVATPLQMIGVRLEGPGLSLFGVVLQGLVVVGVLRLVVVGPGALSWTEMGIRAGLPAAMRDLTWGALLAMPVIFVTALAIAGLVTIVGAVPDSPLPPTGSMEGLAINLLAGAVIAPVYEELLFRGFATTAWARVVSPTAAIARTSLLFALAHVLTQGGATFSEAFGLAIVAAGARLPVAFALGWVFLRRRSLWASIGLHATFNGVLIIIAERAFAG